MAKTLLRPPLRTFKNYVAGKPIEETRREYNLKGRIAKLASNENPLGVSPKARQAVLDHVDDLWLYPDDNSYYFRQKVAERHHCEPEQVFPASGSVEVIELAGTAFLEAGDNVVTSEHTFAIYYLATMKAGAELRQAPMIDDGYRYDLDAMAALVDERTKIVFLANPTNPTGTWFDADEFDAFMEKIPEDVLVVYDSAYEEFLTEPNMPDPYRYFDEGRRIVIMRTFSKAYGLAGIRAGYGIGPVDIIHGLMTCRFPFNMNLLAQVAAIAAIDDVEFIEQSKQFAVKELEFLRNGLEGLPITVPPSQGNFVLVDTDKDAQELYVELMKQGVITRPMGGYGYPGALRVNIGLREDNANFLKEFKALLEK